MQLFKSLLAGATLVASAVAAQGRLRFTSFNPTVEVGDPVTVTWAGGQEGPVTITLRKGESTNLHDVAVLTTAGTGGSYTWVPESNLEEAGNYALQISQGDDVNYTGQFSIEGGSPDAPTTTAATATTDVTATADPTTAPTTAASTYATSDISATSDTSATSPASSSSVTPSSSPTPSSSTPSSSSSLVTSKSSSSASPTSDESNTVTVNPSGTITASGTTSPSAAPTNGAASMASPLALAMGIFAAVVYLN